MHGIICILYCAAIMANTDIYNTSIHFCNNWYTYKKRRMHTSLLHTFWLQRFWSLELHALHRHDQAPRACPSPAAEQEQTQYPLEHSRDLQAAANDPRWRRTVVSPAATQTDQEYQCICMYQSVPESKARNKNLNKIQHKTSHTKINTQVQQSWIQR